MVSTLDSSRALRKYADRNHSSSPLPSAPPLRWLLVTNVPNLEPYVTLPLRKSLASEAVHLVISGAVDSAVGSAATVVIRWFKVCRALLVPAAVCCPAAPVAVDSI